MSGDPQLQFKIVGMDCAEEASVLKREVGPLVGGENNLSFDILNAKMTVSAKDADPKSIAAAVARTGMSTERSRNRR